LNQVAEGGFSAIAASFNLKVSLCRNKLHCGVLSL